MLPAYQGHRNGGTFLQSTLIPPSDLGARNTIGNDTPSLSEFVSTFTDKLCAATHRVWQSKLFGAGRGDDR